MNIRFLSSLIALLLGLELTNPIAAQTPQPPPRQPDCGVRLTPGGAMSPMCPPTRSPTVKAAPPKSGAAVAVDPAHNFGPGVKDRKR